jgi:hypothetical protein
MKIKKLFFLLLIVFLFIGTTYAEELIPWEADYSFKTTLVYNTYGPNYQGYGPSLGKNCPLKKDDTVLIEVSGISDKDVPRVFFSIIDRSPKASFWENITPKNTLIIENIKAGVPFSYKFESTIKHTPYSKQSAKFVFMHDYMKIKKIKLTNCKIKFTVIQKNK